MPQPLVRTSLIFTSALVGGVVSPLAGVLLPLDKLVEGLFTHHDASQRRKLKAFGESMAEELAVIGPEDEGTRNAVCLTIETAIQRFPISHRRLVELNLDPAKATAELAPRLDFAAPSDRTELEDWCKKLIHHYYDKLPRHAHILAEMLPDLWAVVLRRLGDLQELVATMAANDAERRALQTEVNALRADGHMLDRAIITLLQDVGERIGDPSQYPAQLRRAGERYQELLAEAERPRNLPPEFEAVRREAAELIRDGRLDEADALLASLRLEMATWRAEQQAMLQQASFNEAIVLAQRARIAKTRFRYRDAATFLAEASDLTAFDREASRRLRIAQADLLQAYGREFGDDVALCEAIAVYDLALALVPRTSHLADWAIIQVSLGNALATVGRRGTDTEPLERTIEAYEAALPAYNRESVPLDWAGLQSNLGKAREALGSRESGTATLQRAAEAFEAALLEYTWERVPNFWAVTHENLATARLQIGRRRGDADEVRAALLAVEATLEVYRAADESLHIWRAERIRERIMTALGNLAN